MTFIAFVEGPLVWIAFLTFFIGKRFASPLFLYPEQ